MSKNTYYTKCENCDSNLDPNERCSCQNKNLKSFTIDVSQGGTPLVWSYGGYDRKLNIGHSCIIAGSDFEMLIPVTLCTETNGRHERFILETGMFIVMAYVESNNESYFIYLVESIDIEKKEAIAELVFSDNLWHRADTVNKMTDCQRDMASECISAAVYTARKPGCQTSHYYKKGSRRHEHGPYRKA